MMFQDGCDKDMNLNQLTNRTVENIPVDIEPEMPTIAVIPDDTVDS